MASTSSTIPDPVNRLTGTEAENKNVEGSDNAEMSNQQTMADSSQLPVYQQISESIIPNILGRLTEAKNFLLKNVDGHDNANMLDNLEKLIADLKERQELLRKNFAGHDDTACRGALVKTVLESIFHGLSIINLKTDGDDGKEVALRAVQLEAELDKLNGIVSKLKLQLPVDFEFKPYPKVSKIYEVIIPAVVAHLQELAKKFSLGGDDQSTGVQVQKLTNDLSDIGSYFKKLEDNPDSRNKLKNIVLALLRYSFFDDLVTAPEAQAKQFQAKLRVLNNVLIKLKDQISSPNKLQLTDFDDHWYDEVNREFDYSQLPVYQQISGYIIPNLLRRLTEAENFLRKNVKGNDNANMLDNLKNLIAGLKEIQDLLIKNFVGHDDTAARGAHVKTVLESILHGLSIINLETDGAVQLIKAEFDKLNEIVSKLKLQLQVDSVFTPYPTVSKIYEVIIPAVVAHMQELAKKFSLGDDDQSTGVQVKKLTNDLSDIGSYVKKLEDNPDSRNKLKNIVLALLRYSFFDDLVTAPEAQAKQFQAKLRVLNNVLIKLKDQISSPNKLQLTDFDDHWYEEVNREFDYSQLPVYPQISGYIIPNLLRRLTQAGNFLLKNVKGNDNANMLDNLKKLNAGLKEIQEFLIKNFAGHDATAGRGVLVKTVLERILHGLSIINLKTDGDDGKEVALRAVQLKAELDKLNGIVSKLKLQLRVDFEFTPCPTVSKINEVIIPAVVASLELANEFSLGDDDRSTAVQVQKLTNDLSYIRSYVKKLEDNSDSLNKLKNIVYALLRYSFFDDLITAPEAQAKQFQAKLRVLNNVLIKVKHQISSPNKLPLTDFDDHWYDEVNTEFDYSQVLEIFPVLHVGEGFKISSAFQHFRKVYDNLELRTKMCLLCFAIIPENEVVKKRFMTYWWVGEGFVSPLPDKTYEKAADEIFEELAKEDCIETVDEKLRFAVDSYRMNPFIRSALNVLAKEAGFFDFDGKKGYPTADLNSFRACLVDGLSQQLFKTKKNDQSESTVATGLDPEKLQVIFNVNEPYPDVFELEWFSKLKNVKVLYLGRWQTSAKHHIEVEGTKFLEGLKTMKLLRFLSLQGISRITELPRSVCQLPNLRILDLRGCHNLESLPDRIGSLRTLTHLDISECYLLDSMPKGIANLSQLQVLKGFVMSDRDSRPNICTLDLLSNLENLRKLSIYTNKKTFPEDAEVTTLQKLKVLQKLTITWGAGAFPPKPASTTSTSNKVADNKTQDVGVDQTTTPKINRGRNKNQDKKETQAMTTNTETTKPFKTLKKLDLKCYPCTTAPSWLRPGKLPELKKLYIRGGNLQNLSTSVQENNKWPKVEVIRLKFLSDLKMDWKKLRSSFPDLIYLENFKCPKLTYFPCNENGVVWLRSHELKDGIRAAVARNNN